MKKFSLFIMITLLICSCCGKKPRITELSDDSKRWIPYQIGAKTYYSDGVNLDSIEVIHIDKRLETIGHWCVGKVEEMDMNIIGNRIAKLRVALNYLSLHFNLEVDSVRKHFTLPLKEDTNPISEVPIHHSTFEINNISYHDVLVLTKDSLELYYGKNEGIIAYKVGEKLFIKQ
ncbi:MAG TPA: hypothetical protein PLP27_10810 [Crocinitomicaceae bacterium]|nr:hypothetical protein [Crocinitomicaceae bacterium]